MENNPAYKSLVEMGISEIMVNASIRNVKSQNVDPLLDWIQQHADQQQKWKKWLEENPVQAQQKQEEKKQSNQSISSLINQQMSAALISKGNSKNVAEKSLLFTNNASIESAEAWIQQHKYDADFQEQLLLQGKAYKQSSLTQEQAKQKLKQLTEKARQLRKKREDEQAIQRQKNRVRYGKQMIEAKRIAEEQAIKRQMELDKIQKQKDQAYKKQLLQKMRREKQQKLGIKSSGGTNQIQAKKEQPKLSKLEQFQVQCQQVKVGMHAYPDKAKVFFDTAQIYVSNMLKNKGEEKFMKINKENKAFQTRISQVFGGVQTLMSIGYIEEGTFLVMKNYNEKQLEKFLQIINRYISFY